MLSLSFQRSASVALVLLVGLGAAGCLPGVDGGAAAGAATGGGSEGNGGGDSGSGGDTQSSMSQFMNGSGGGTTDGGCYSGANDDLDMDGWTVADGDCNDCDPNSNPGAIEVIGTPPDDGSPYVPVDEDCDGTPDNPPAANCDMGLDVGDNDPMDGARAIDVCKVAATDKDYGVVKATYVRANGDPVASSLQYGILSNFGPYVDTRGGARMLAISSGRGRLPNQNGACNSCSCTDGGSGTPPSADYPQNAANCPISTEINDDIGLQLDLRAPTNATGYKFDFKFYSFEYPDYICNAFNDQFMALVTPAPEGALAGNISFGPAADGSPAAPVSVNISFFTVCSGCQDGANELQGNGFEEWTCAADDGNAGGTAWLQTQAPVEGGSAFQIRFGIWDTGDDWLDSTALIDNFQWIADGGMVTVGTDVAPPQ